MGDRLIVPGLLARQITQDNASVQMKARLKLLKKTCWRKPDNVVWSKPWDCCMLGFAVQKYGFNAVAVTVCIGILTLRWHNR
jgi:hypothetical protein